VKVGERSRAVVVSLVVGVAVATPAVRMLANPSTGDGFPLSTFPMFTEDHGRVLDLPTVVEVAGSGPGRLSPRQIAGTDQVVQAWQTVRDAVEDGPEATRRLCEEVAGRLDGPARLEVVVERYDAVAWAADPDAGPETREVLVRCGTRR
jgi:hypothetical protein